MWKPVSWLPKVIVVTGFILLSAGAHAGAPDGWRVAAESTHASQQLRPLGHLPGAALSLAVHGNTGYLGFSYELVVLDLANRAYPRWVADLPLPTSDMVVQDPLAYVVGRGGFTVLDLSDPWRPVSVATLPTEATPGAVAAAGDRAYFAVFERIHVVDVSEPAAPRPLGDLRLSTRVQSIVVRGAYAYVAASDGLHIINVADSRALREVTVVPTADWAHSVTVVDDRVIFAAGSQVVVVDISTPAQPALLACVDAPNPIGRMAMVGGTAYLASTQAGLQAMNLASGATLAAAEPAPGALPEKVLVLDGYAYVVDSGEGLRIFAIDAQGPPREVGWYAALGVVIDLAVDGGRAFVISGWNADLHAVDVGMPARLHRAGRRFAAGPVHGLAVQGGRVYLVDDTGLRIFDVSTVGQDRQVGALGLAYLNAITVAGECAYLTNARGEMWVVDVSDPAAIRVVERLPGPGHVGGIVVTGGRAYMPYVDGVLIAAVQADGSLRRLGAYPMATAPDKIAVAGVHLYVAAGAAGLHVVDVTNPAQPKLVAVIDTPGNAHDVAVWKNAILVADGEAGAILMDLSQLGVPMRVDTYTTYDCAQAVALANDVVYVADRFGGIWIFALG